MESSKTQGNQWKSAGQSHVNVVTGQCPDPGDTAVPPVSTVATCTPTEQRRQNRMPHSSLSWAQTPRALGEDQDSARSQTAQCWTWPSHLAMGGRLSESLLKCFPGEYWALALVIKVSGLIHWHRSGHEHLRCTGCLLPCRAVAKNEEEWLLCSERFTELLKPCSHWTGLDRRQFRSRENGCD